MLNKPVTINVTSPLSGLNVNLSRIEQDYNFTASCSDVLPYDRDFRMRVSQRPGSSAGTATTLGTGAGSCFVQGPSTLYYVLGTVCAGFGKAKVYYINAGTVKENAGSLAATTATPVPTTYSLATIWRNRLVLAGSDHKWIMSHVDDYGNFDVGDTTVARAIAGTNAIYSSPGAIQDSIISLIPWNDDVLIVACDHTMWAIKGDPAYGGSINLLNNGVGILAGNAWSIDPQGQLWMVGTGGVYKFMGGSFELASQNSYSAYFQAITRSATAVTCAWDRDRHGLYIFKPSGGGLFYDARRDGFWPITTNASAAYVFDGTAPADRYIHYASGGSVLKIDSAQTQDSGGNTLSAYLWIGPIMPAGPTDQAICNQIDLVLGDVPAGYSSTQFRCNYTLQGGVSPNDALNNPNETRTGTATGPGRATIGVRMQATCFFLKLSTAASYDPGGGTVYPFFSFENANFHFLPGGRGRT